MLRYSLGLTFFIMNKILNRLWWRFMPGMTIHIDRKMEKLKIANIQYTIVHYRDLEDWLTEHAGRRGWDWDLKTTMNDYYNIITEIKFRKGKESIAVLTKLQWL